MSSPVCRCQETGQLMAVGSVETSWDLLPDTGPSPVRFLALKEMVSSWRGPGTLVLVTHALTVNPLTGFLPEQAGTVVLQPALDNPRRGSLVGRIAPPEYRVASRGARPTRPASESSRRIRHSPLPSYDRAPTLSARGWTRGPGLGTSQ